MSKTKATTNRYYLPLTGNYSVEQWNGSSDSPYSASRWGNTQSTITVGDNLPNWMRLIRLGENATTSMTATVERVQPLRWGTISASWSYVPDFASTNWYKRSGHITGLFCGSPILAATSVPTSSKTAEDQALARFNSRVQEVNRQFQGGVFFAELAKTLHGLRHPAEALFKGLGDYSTAAMKLRKKVILKYVRDKKRAGTRVGPLDLRDLSKRQRRIASKEFTKAATGLWLEKTFHWLPLMYDIQGAVSALKHTWDRLPSEFVKVSATDVQSRAAEFSQQGTAFILADVKVVQTVSASVRMYGRVRAGTRVANWPDSKALGYDIRSFIPTLWELLPYSWAVDYFTNIGDILYGLSYGGQDVMWCARGIKRSVSRRHTGTADIPQQDPPPLHHTTGWNTIAITSEVLAEKAVLNRATYTGNYIPLFEWSVPGISLKWLNLGAVWLQRSV